MNTISIPRKLSPYVHAICIAMLFLGCNPNDGTDVKLGDSDDVGPGPGDSAVANFKTITWSYDIIEVTVPGNPGGIHGLLETGPDGTRYYAYLKYRGDDAGCDIAVFGGGSAPATNHDLKVAVRKPGEASWTIETVPLDGVPSSDNNAFVTRRTGIDAEFNDAGEPVFAFTAGSGSALGVCGSTDLVLATRATSGAYSFSVPVNSSGACCAPKEECNGEPLCTSGSVVGSWAAIAKDPSGNMGVAYVDYHNYWDEDGQSHQGYEFWHEADGIMGINPWSGTGLYGALVYAQDGTAISAFTHFADRGLFVYRRVRSDRSTFDWDSIDLRPGSDIGERISMRVAADGTIGLAFHEVVRRSLSTNADETVNDLIYCESKDNGVTWTIPCVSIDQVLANLGHTPALRFDTNSQPVIAYRYCGGGTNCAASDDGVHMAWRDDDGIWNTTEVIADASAREGTYVSLTLDPETNAPTVAWQNLTTGAAMVATGATQ